MTVVIISFVITDIFINGHISFTALLHKMFSIVVYCLVLIVFYIDMHTQENARCPQTPIIQSAHASVEYHVI